MGYRAIGAELDRSLYRRAANPPIRAWIGELKAAIAR
jgi:hypothetical protein